MYYVKIHISAACFNSFKYLEKKTNRFDSHETTSQSTLTEQCQNVFFVPKIVHIVLCFT